MNPPPFDEALAQHLRARGREFCDEKDVFEYALTSIANAAALYFYMKTEPTVIHRPDAERYEQVAANTQAILNELP